MRNNSLLFDEYNHCPAHHFFPLSPVGGEGRGEGTLGLLLRNRLISAPRLQHGSRHRQQLRPGRRPPAYLPDERFPFGRATALRPICPNQRDSSLLIVILSLNPNHRPISSSSISNSSAGGASVPASRA